MALSHAQYLYLTELKQSLQAELDAYQAKRDVLLAAKAAYDELRKSAEAKEAVFDSIEATTDAAKSLLREQRLAMRSQINQHKQRVAELNESIKARRAEVESTRNRLSIFDLPALKNELKSYERLHAR